MDALTPAVGDGVECVRADALDPASLRDVLSDIDVAYYLVHSMASGGNFSDLDRRAAANFRDAAANAGVKRTIYLGGIQPSDGASPHLASRMETGECCRSVRCRSLNCEPGSSLDRGRQPSR